MSVVLPEPFSPRSPTMVRGGTTRSIPRLARTGPYDFVMPCMRSIVAPCALRSEGTAGSGAAARVVLGRLDPELAGRDLLLHRLELGGHAGGHRRIERTVRRVPEIGAGGRCVVAVGDVVAGELARAQVGHRGEVDVAPPLVDVRQHPFGGDGRVADGTAGGEHALVLR